MAKEAKAKYLKVPVLYKGVTLEVGTKIEADHEEFEDFEKQGWLADSKALAESKPGAAEAALTGVEEKLTAAEKAIAEKDSKIAELEKDNKALADALAEANKTIAELEKPAAK